MPAPHMAATRLGPTGSDRSDPPMTRRTAICHDQPRSLLCGSPGCATATRSADNEVSGDGASRPSLQQPGNAREARREARKGRLQQRRVRDSLFIHSRGGHRRPARGRFVQTRGADSPPLRTRAPATSNQHGMERCQGPRPVRLPARQAAQAPRKRRTCKG